jgi:hypothetical protein
MSGTAEIEVACREGLSCVTFAGFESATQPGGASECAPSLGLRTKCTNCVHVPTECAGQLIDESDGAW